MLKSFLLSTVLSLESDVSAYNQIATKVKAPTINLEVMLPELKTLNSFMQVLKTEENAQKTGFDKKTGTWFPHASPEGGTDTIAYGHKLTKKEASGNYVMLKGQQVSLANGLTNEQAEALLKQDFRGHYDRAKKHFGNDWQNMSEPTRLLAAEISFNIKGGLSKYPTFTELARDPKTERKAVTEIGRTYFDKKTKTTKPLTKRVNALKNWYKSQ